MAKVIDLVRLQPKQELFCRDTHKHVCFGGARGGGKSHVVRIKAILLAFRYAGIKILIVRQTYKEVIENHAVPMMELLGGVCKYNKSENIIYFPRVNGKQSRIYFSFCNNDGDLTKFQGNDTV